MFNVLGMGIMGRQISALLCLLGYDVCIWDYRKNEERDAIHQRDMRTLRRFLKADVAPGEIQYIDDINKLESAITFEVLIEDLEIKRNILLSLPFKIIKGQLLTNTSSYSPPEIHKQAIGFHFFNPVYLNRFIEIAVPIEELPLIIQEMLKNLENEFGFECIVTSNNRGYIGNYLLFREIASALQLIDKYHYKTNDIDTVLTHMGRTNSLFDIIDLIGVDVCRRIISNLQKEDPSLYLSPLLDFAITNNVLGKKNKSSIRSVIDQ